MGALALFIRTAAPDFLLDDNSEFIGAAYHLGITHAPGYPLLSLIGKLFTWLAPGTAGFSVNLLSAFFSAAAVALTFRLLARATGWWAPALLGATMTAAGRLFWEEAGQAEVYPLNSFFIILSLNIVWELKGDRRDAPRVVALGVVCMLAAMNHYTMALVVPLYLIYLLWLYRPRVALPFLWLAPLLFLAGVCFSANMYLPLRSAVRPVYQWDEQDNARGFYKHLKGVDRRTEAPPVPLIEKWNFAKDYGMRVARERTLFLLLLLPLGLWRLIAREKARGVLLIALWASLFLGFIFLLNFLYGPRASYVVKVFYAASLQMLALGLAFGADTLLQAVRRARLPWQAVFAIIAVLIGYSALTSTATADHSKDLLAVRYGLNMLRTTARDGVIFATLETEAFPLANLRSVSGIRRDVTLHGRQGDSIGKAYAIGKVDAGRMSFTNFDQVQDFVVKNTSAAREVYFTKRLNVKTGPQSGVYSDGLLYHLNPLVEKLVRSDPWKRVDMTGIDFKYPEYDMLQKTVITRYIVMRGEQYIEMGNWDKALREFDRAIRFNPKSSFLRSQLGAIYLTIGDLERARQQYEAGLAMPPENVEIGIDAVASYSNLSYIYGRLGDAEKALEYVRTAVKFAPDIGVLRVNLGYTYWQQNQYHDAVEQLEAAIRLGVDSAAIRNILGICYEKLGHYDLAEKNYERALDMNPAYPDVYRDYGIFNAYIANRPERAIELLGAYLDFEKNAFDESNIRVNIAYLDQNVGRHEDAVVQYRKALELGAGDSPGKTAKLNRLLARSLEKIGKTDEARAAFEAGLPGADQDPEFYRDYAEFLDRTKESPKLALELLDKYLAAVPNAQDKIKIDLLKTQIKSRMGK